MPNDLISREAAKAAIEAIRNLGIDGDTSGLKSVLSKMLCDAFSEAIDALPAADAGEGTNCRDAAQSTE